MQWIVKEPFPGHVQSVLNKDNTVAHDDHDDGHQLCCDVRHYSYTP